MKKRSIPTPQRLEKLKLKRNRQLQELTEGWVDAQGEGRFWNRVRKIEGGCWIWEGCISSNGYGKLRHRGLMESAHRISFIISNKRTIPPNLVIDHICRNRACVNPAHLRLLTSAQNLLCGQGTPARNARKTHCKRGHEFTPENTKLKPRHGKLERSCRQCTREMKKLRYWKKIYEARSL